MLRHAIVLGALGLSAFARDPGGCGGGVDSSSAGVNAPCTRDKDCAGGLRCIEGVCTAPSSSDAGGDAGSDSGAKDAADDG